MRIGTITANAWQRLLARLILAVAGIERFIAGRAVPMRKPSTIVATLMALIGVAAGSAPASASGYIYRPGDPMRFYGGGYVNTCTGGYIITGGSGTFLTTDGHCADKERGGVGSPVYGIPGPFGTVAYTKSPYQDTELISEYPSDDRWQTVVDPTTGRLPGGSGRVVDFLKDQQLVPGVVIGKMGVTSGWTEGQIAFTRPYSNMLSYCTTAYAAPGDSGGPVWQAAVGGGVHAVGLMVYKYTDNRGSFTCFLSIADILYVWGATYFPVWTSGARSASRAGVAAPTTAPQPPGRAHSGGTITPLVGIRTL